MQERLSAGGNLPAGSYGPQTKICRKKVCLSLVICPGVPREQENWDNITGRT